MKRRLISLLATIPVLVAVLITFSFTPTEASAKLPRAKTDQNAAFAILHTNDSHGHIRQTEKELGFAVVSGTKKCYELAGIEVLLVDAGDVLHGMPEATLSRGADIVRIMNFAGYDVMVPGNHDFNYGVDRLIELSKMMNFPIISANIFVKKTGKPLFEPSIIIEKAGLRLGFFGLTTPETAYKTNPKNVESVEFRNPIKYAKMQVAELKKKNVDYIIALTHLGVDASSEYTSYKIAEAVPGIDIIIDGHSHTAMSEGKTLADNFRLVEHRATLIASTGEYINNLGRITICPDGAISAQLLSPGFKNIPSDPDMSNLIAGISMLSDVVLSEAISYTEITLDGEREASRSRETNLGNLVTDAFRVLTAADVAFTNGGGIRASIPAGEITRRDIAKVFPFRNHVVTKRVSGKALLAAMEHGVKDYPNPSGGFPQVSGITFKIDVSKPAGSRVVNAKVGGRALDPKAVYLLATNDFIAAGGDAYTMLGEFPIVNEYGTIEEILIEYIKGRADREIGVYDRITVIPAAFK